jgi:hypothetical protein
MIDHLDLLSPLLQVVQKLYEYSSTNSDLIQIIHNMDIIPADVNALRSLLLQPLLSGEDAVVASAGDPSSVLIAAAATAEAAASASASASSAFGHGSLEVAFAFSKKPSLPPLSGLDEPGAPRPIETV